MAAAAPLLPVLGFGGGDGTPAPLLWLAGALAVCALVLLAVFAHRRWLDARLEAERARWRAEAALAEDAHRKLQSEHLTSVGRLAGGLAHEVNSPLGYMRSNLEYLKEEFAPESPRPLEMREVIDDVLAGVDRIAFVIRDLVDLSHDGPADASASCVPAAVVDAAVRLAAARLGGRVPIEPVIAEGLPLMRGDAHRLTQVLSGLLLDAGEMALRTVPEAWHIRLEVRARGGRVEVSIDDPGPREGDPVRPPIFEAPSLARLRPALGLAMAREYAVRCGGALVVGGAGAPRFVLALPAVGESMARRAHARRA